MRFARNGIGWLAACAGLLACVDIFHSTDVSAICDETPGFQECPKTPGPEGYCTTDATEVRKRAEHACAWLGACEGAAESNALGACLGNALSIFQCSDATLDGADSLHNKWDCLRLAQSCHDVDLCVYGREPVAVCEESQQTITSCVAGRIHVICQGSARPTLSEDCALLGRTCSTDVSGGICRGPCATGVPCGGGAQVACATCDEAPTRACPEGATEIRCTNFGLTCDQTKTDRCSVRDAN